MTDLIEKTIGNKSNAPATPANALIRIGNQTSLILMGGNPCLYLMPIRTNDCRGNNRLHAGFAS
jgi:hypothetical protein